MDSLKSWFVNIAAKEMLPSLVRAGLAAATGLLVAHAGLLAGWESSTIRLVGRSPST